MNPLDEEDTGEHLVPLLHDVLPPPAVSSRVQVDLAGLSHQGNVRSNNEDHYLVVKTERTLQTLLTNLPAGDIPDCFGEVGYGMVVADGMGGMAGGEVASRLAISTLVNLALNTSDWIMRAGEWETEEVLQRMADRYRRIDTVLRMQAQNDPALSGMGTTMTLAVSIGRDLLLTHIGDSRAYLLHRNQLHQLTRDQTLAQSLADQGVISQEDTATHRLRHVLTSALGGGKERIAPEVRHLVLHNEDQVLLCTDGLTELVTDATIAAILRGSGSAQEACSALVELALRNGGKDNVTVVLARYRIPPGV